MADSLADLGAQLSKTAGSAPAPAPAATPSPAPSPLAAQPDGPFPQPAVRGDALMAQAQALSNLSPEDQAGAKLFYQSKDIITARMQQDPAYAERLLGEMSKLKGRELTDKVVDEADQSKIDFLRQTEPELFNGPMAAMNSFSNTATFGQLSRLQGYAGQLIDGKPADQTIREQAEKLRLLQKAYPKSNLVGAVAAFMIPGSPARGLFEGAAALGGEAVAKLLGRVVQNPSLMTKVAAAVGAGAAGGASLGGVEGTLGTGDQPVSFDRGAESALANGAGGALLAGAFTGAGGAAGKVFQGAGARIGAALDKTVEQVTGTSAKALRAFNADPAAIKAASGTQTEIGQDLVDYLLNQKRSNLPEVAQANDLLTHLPNVSADGLIDYLRSFKAGRNPQLDSQVSVLQQWADRIEASLPADSEAANPALDSIARKRAILNATTEAKGRALDEAIASKQQEIAAASGDPNTISAKQLTDFHAAEKQNLIESARAESSRLDAAESGITQQRQTMIPATKMREIVDDLQNAAADHYGQDSPFLGNALKTAARRARLTIADSATQLAADGAKADASPDQQQLGQVAQTYNQLMSQAAEKRGILNFLVKQMGRNPDTMEKRAQGFISNLFGANKDIVQSRMQALDQKFGTNFYELSQNASFAKQLGPDGTPQVLPTHRTGATTLGSIFGAAAIGTAGAVLGGLLDHGLGAIAGAVGGGKLGEIVGEAVGGAVSSPKMGARILGASDKITGFVNQMTQNPTILSMIAKDKASSPIVKNIAGQLTATLAKDGPISAGSMTRIIADTPFFLGLVHAFDLNQQRAQSKRVFSAVQKVETRGR